MAHTRLLIRTTALDDRVVAFADSLADASGCPVAFVADERRAPIDARGRDVVGLSVPACAALGLYCPDDFAWKCGDYGYYLARARFPETMLFWLIEYDVRFGGGDPAGLFDFFAKRPDVDLLAPHFQPALPEWYWTRTLNARDALPYRCLFPVTRLSARAIDVALDKRVEHSGKRLRRLIWPNDEAHVATTLVYAGLECRDFNAFGTSFYSDATFTFTEPIDGDAFMPTEDGLRMYHPVLYGDAYRRKMANLRQPEYVLPFKSRQVRRVARKINAMSRW